MTALPDVVGAAHPATTAAAQTIAVALCSEVAVTARHLLVVRRKSSSYSANEASRADSCSQVNVPCDQKPVLLSRHTRCYVECAGYRQLGGVVVEGEFEYSAATEASSTSDQIASRRAERHFEMVVSSLDEGVVVLDPSGRVGAALARRLGAHHM
jgi:hypothetical protein